MGQLLSTILVGLSLLSLSACKNLVNTKGPKITGGTAELTGGGGGPEAEAIRKRILFTLQYLSQNRGQYAIPASDWCPASDALAIIENPTYVENAIEIANHMVIKFVDGTLTYEGSVVNAFLRRVDPTKEKYDTGIDFIAEINATVYNDQFDLASHEMFHNPKSTALQDAWNPAMREKLNRVGKCISTFYQLYTAPGRKMWEITPNRAYYTRAAVTDENSFLSVNNEKNAAPLYWTAQIERHQRDGQSQVVLTIPAFHAIALEKTANGKWIVAGVNFDGTGGYRISRYNGNFQLDTSFNGSGHFTSNLGSYSQLGATRLLADGSIVSGGYSYNPSQSAYQFVVTKNLSTGVLDTTFGTNGILKLAMGPYLHSVVRKIVAKPAGGFLALGFSSQESSTSGVAPYGQSKSFILSFKADGTYEASFGNNGLLLIDSPMSFIARDLLVQSDGKLIVTGDSYSSALTYITTLRVNPDGTLDSTFGSRGFISVTFSADNQTSHQLLGFADQVWVLGSFKQSNGRFAAILAIDGSGNLLDKYLTPTADRKGIQTYAVPSTVEDSSIRGSVAADGGVFLNLGNWFSEVLGVRPTIL